MPVQILPRRPHCMNMPAFSTAIWEWLRDEDIEYWVECPEGAVRGMISFSDAAIAVQFKMLFG